MKRFIALTLLAATAAHGQVNTQFGQQAAASELYSADISVFGYQALYACDYCFGTTAIGYEALRVASGSYNTALGFDSMVEATSGYANTGVGAYSLTNLGGGSYNIAVGYNAGSCSTVNGSNNIWVGHCGMAKDNAVIRIGTQGTQKFTQIAGIRGTIVKGGQAVVVSASGQLGVAKLTVVPNVDAPQVSAADIQSLRAELAATKNMIYKLQSQVAAMQARR